MDNILKENGKEYKGFGKLIFEGKYKQGKEWNGNNYTKIIEYMKVNIEMENIMEKN